MSRKMGVEILIKPYFETTNGKLYCSDCRPVLIDMPSNSVDGIVTDPPYELGFMGKHWDSSGIAYNLEVWEQAFRVLKPGGHLLSFGGTRTYHRMVVAIEDAGFEIRDMINWVYGSGFPKGLNIGKAIDKKNGCNPTIIREYKADPNKFPEGSIRREEIKDNYKTSYETTPSSPEAKKWEGWGTGLKPAHEPIVLARKPLSEKTVADNVLKHGTGGINIDGCRVGKEYAGNLYTGRFPANLLHDGSDEVLKEFEKAGNCGAFAKVKSGQKGFGGIIYGEFKTGGDDGKTFYNDGLGTPARFFQKCEMTEEDYSPFFYCSKANTTERNFGCGKNNHPTVKPIKLMEYLIKLIIPKEGIVLDPFAGSGTTCVAAEKNDFKWIGIDLTDKYCDIAKARIVGVSNDTFINGEEKGDCPEKDRK
jgi:DNA modification methylase